MPSQVNKNIVEREQNAGTSNVSNLVKKEEKAYVRRYAMSEGSRRVWLENNRCGESNEIMFPSKREAMKRDIATPERRQRARALILGLCIAAILMIASVFAVYVGSRLVIKEVRVDGSTTFSAEQLMNAGGLTVGDKLPLLTASDIEEELIKVFPYIKSCSVSIELPNTVVFNITDESAAVYSSIFGEYYALSPELRVLERAESADEFSHLLYIELPRVSRAVVGEKVVFADGLDGTYIIEFLDLFSGSELAGRAGIIYFDEKYDIVASVDDKFRILFGSPIEMSLKLKAACHIIEQNIDDCETGSVVDVRVVDIAGIVVNANIDPNSRE